VWQKADCPSDYPDKTSDHAGVVVCDDEPGGDDSLQVAYEYFRDRCAALDSAEACDCEWISADRHWFVSDGQCTKSMEGVCLFTAREFGATTMCVERPIDDGTEALYLWTGYEVVPGWTKNNETCNRCRGDVPAPDAGMDAGTDAGSGMDVGSDAEGG
jgi:hypothetical protein